MDEKTNGIKAIPELLDIVYLKGCVVTIDDMGTQNEIAEKIIEKEADYILQVKGNQENLMKDIALYFEKDIFPCKKKELEKRDRYYKEMCFEHGRQEIREYYVENSIDWLKECHPKRKGLNGTDACILTVTEKGETNTAISFSIYSQEWGLKNMEKAKGLIGELRTACTGNWV